jgi:alkyl sulfatase BDS1-like metallo-beta-lactamase superfamily hydrolase
MSTAASAKELQRGRLTLIPPNATIDKALETRTIDGVEIVFKLVPGSEAPTEMLMYFPHFRVLDMAEDVTHTLHNLYAIRGAEVRDGNLWSRYTSEALETFGDKTDVLIAQHHWPAAGQARVVELLKRQRDLYKFINDQSLRLANKGFTPDEIAETLRLPQTLQREWSARGYYGTLRHNAKAVYQKYLGWYDGNPADLDPLPAVESARKTIDYMGGADAVIVRARADFARGEYRWVASAMKQVVFAEPTNRPARELGADAMEQLAYQAESATWRNAYLQGASELRNGTPNIPGFSTANAEHLEGDQQRASLRTAGNPAQC